MESWDKWRREDLYEEDDSLIKEFPTPYSETLAESLELEALLTPENIRDSKISARNPDGSLVTFEDLFGEDCCAT